MRKGGLVSLHWYMISFEFLFHIQYFMPYILSTFSRTDVSLGGPAIHVAGTGASRSPQ